MGVKGVGEAALTLCEAGINFDGRLLQPGASIEDALLEVIEEVQPELVVLGSSQRTGSYLRETASVCIHSFTYVEMILVQSPPMWPSSVPSAWSSSSSLA